MSGYGLHSQPGLLEALRNAAAKQVPLPVLWRGYVWCQSFTTQNRLRLKVFGRIPIQIVAQQHQNIAQFWQLFLCLVLCKFQPCWYVSVQFPYLGEGELGYVTRQAFMIYDLGSCSIVDYSIIYIYVYIYICIYTYICIHIYIYTYICE